MANAAVPRARVEIPVTGLAAGDYAAGDYVAVVDAAQIGVGWFSDAGRPALTIRIGVR